MTLGNAIAITFFIILYFSAFCKLFSKVLRTNYIIPTLLLILLIFHFSIFKVNDTNNKYLFGALNLTCIWYYLIPDLFNCFIILCLMQHNDQISNPLVEGLFLLGTWLAVFSNLFSSIIIVSYAGVTLLFSIVYALHSGQLAIKILKEKINFIIILLFWIISLLYESNGQRANAFSTFNISESINCLQKYLTQFNKTTIFSLLIFIVLGCICFIFSKKKEEDKKYISTIILLLLCLIVDLAFLVLLDARTNAGDYLRRSEVIFGPCFFLFLIAFISIAYVLNYYPKLFIPLPLLFFSLLCITLQGNHIFLETNISNINSKISAAISEAIVSQVVQADKNHLDSAKVFVPKYKTANNWPLSNYMGHSIGLTLYRHGITSRFITVEIVPDEMKNIEFGLSQ